MYRLAADRGNTEALLALARLRDQAGDPTDAVAVLRQAVNRGCTWALQELARRRDKAGDAVRADRIRWFGLTGSGEIATGLDFGS